jgi:hypothetical protein
MPPLEPVLELVELAPLELPEPLPLPLVPPDPLPLALLPEPPDALDPVLPIPLDPPLLDAPELAAASLSWFGLPVPPCHGESPALEHATPRPAAIAEARAIHREAFMTISCGAIRIAFSESTTRGVFLPNSHRTSGPTSRR